MLNIEKTLQSVRDLLDRLDKEGVEFALVESKYCNCVAGIQDPKDDVRVFLDCTIGTDGRFSWQDYDGHEGLCDFDEFRVLIINLTADRRSANSGQTCVTTWTRPCRILWPPLCPAGKARRTVCEHCWNPTTRPCWMSGTLKS
ncbi:hypothetical protein BLIC_c01458 [Bifidobacterium longum subsp. infantis]|uniref:Uncharacterized protein n=1 Tax=Bifidobacterium longum subsp. infantis TaxID=1682 RepID=A0ABM9R4Y3_BIFLI|nr:hypothetical protein BLIC_c01458 [Bifidobacterium longum subsp. infantis]CEF09315.1 hypothetical protein BLIC_g01447 [Bifidobacterium longum subsp. infantis]CEF09470.1 hypothetical protein BLIC_d01446 [Bifidobacterium longum subsp. infantis]VUX27683.1 hypothetical protein USA001_01457 [Bifidobacterium longum subsp. infantis]